METHNAVECPAEAMASKLSGIERLRDALPVASRVLQRIAVGLPATLPEGFDRCDEALIEQSERLRDALAGTEPESLQGAVAQMIVAERDWLSGDPQLRQRAISMIERAVRFIESRADSITDSQAWSRGLRLLPVSTRNPD
ncbi:MAG: hypothetical protein GC196_01225 [Hyphomonas sp.]|nr:hypothetical protein [Hyphomonas sp.]